MGSGPAGLAHRVRGHGPGPAGRRVRPPRRRPGSGLPPPRERASPGRSPPAAPSPGTGPTPGMVVAEGGEKMSKSLGNTLSLLELLDAHDPRAFRLQVLQSHYRSPMTVSSVHPGRGRGGRRAPRRLRPGVRRRPGRRARSGRPGPLPGAHGRRSRHARRRSPAPSSCCREARSAHGGTGDRAWPRPCSASSRTPWASRCAREIEEVPAEARAKAGGARRGPGRQGLGRGRRPPGRAAGRRLDCRGRTRRDHTSPVSDFDRDTAHAPRRRRLDRRPAAPLERRQQPQRRLPARHRRAGHARGGRPARSGDA